MAKLSIKLNVLPGIVRDIDITLEDLLKSFNTSWDLEDRMDLILGLDLDDANNTIGVKAIARVFNNLNIDNLTIGQLIILDKAIENFKTKIDIKKQEIIKE